MAIRQFAIKGKLVNSSPGNLDTGPTGEFGLDIDDTAGLFLSLPEVTSSNSMTKYTYFGWYHPFTLDLDIVLTINDKPSSVSNSVMWIATSSSPSGGISLLGSSDPDGATLNLSANSQGALISVNAWNSILVSVDMTAASIGDGLKVWVNDVEATMTGSFQTPNPIRWNDTNNFISVWKDFTSGNSIDGYVSAVWFDFDRFVDFDVEANRRKFIDSDGRPVSLGFDGSVPFGAPPTMYFDNPVSLYNVNRGSGPNFRFWDSASGGTEDQNAFLTAPTNPATGTLA